MRSRRTLRQLGRLVPIGLAIVQRVIRSHEGGRISAQRVALPTTNTVSFASRTYRWRGIILRLLILHNYLRLPSAGQGASLAAGVGKLFSRVRDVRGLLFLASLSLSRGDLLC